MVEIGGEQSHVTRQNTFDEAEIKNEGADDFSNQYTTHDVGPVVGHESSFGANSTAMTFPGVQVEAAILTDGEEGPQEIQIIDRKQIKTTEADSGANNKKVKQAKVSPRAAVLPRKATKNIEVGEKIKIDDLGEPMEPIVLTEQERKMLKQVVFRNYFTQLDPVFRKVANKEVNAINKTLASDLDLRVTQIGEHKSCEQIVKENIKDYKGIVKAAGFDSPNLKFKHILGQSSSKSTGLKELFPGTRVVS